MGYRSATPEDAARVNRKITHNRLKIHYSFDIEEDFCRKLTFASCVCYSGRAWYGSAHVLKKDIGGRLPLVLAIVTRGLAVTLQRY